VFSQDQDITVTIIVATLLFLLLASFCLAFLILYHKRKMQFQNEKLSMESKFKQEILKTQLETQEETFQQIGEELHDNIGQLLSSTKMLLGITERSLPSVPDTLKTAEEMLGKAIQDLRSLSKALSKEWLHQFNLVENLQIEIDRINSAKGLQIELYSTDSFLPLSAESQVILFRIIQEAIQNILKHAEATKISISIAFEKNIQIKISDNGKGFSESKGGTKTGLGLINMEHRAKVLGGELKIESTPSAGTNIDIVVPVQNENL
jgi:signal transduction histidine kinase